MAPPKNMNTVDSSYHPSMNCSFSNVTGNAHPFPSRRTQKRSLDQFATNTNQPFQLESLCKAFKNNVCSLNSPFHKLDQDGFRQIQNSLEYYKSFLQEPEASKWCIECGESSKTYLSLAEAAKDRLVCYVLARRHKVIGKFVVSNAERKLIVPRIRIDASSNLLLLKNMHDLSKAAIKDAYQAPTNHTKLSDVREVTVSRLQMYGVVTAVNKLPTQTKSSWHSLLCISDPSLQVLDDDEDEKDSPPGEFKMHLFLPSLEDHPEFHRGDIVRFINVKIEAHKSRCDGRVFKKSDIIIYCHPDSKVPVLRENIEERSAVIRLLSHWWSLNHRFFDYLTPHPIYHLLSRYPGIRSFKELSDQLVCDLYCQVVSMSDDSSDLNFMCVRDGTIFTLEKRQKPTADNPAPVAVPSEWPTFGYLALAIFDQIPWKRIKALKIGANDYIFMKDVKAVFLSEETLANLRSFYTYRHPCVLLRPAAEGVKKVEASHHEAYKIRSRLHRLPEELEKMDNWKFPESIEEEIQDDPLVARLNNPSVQMSLLKRLKRS